MDIHTALTAQRELANLEVIRAFLFHQITMMQHNGILPRRVSVTDHTEEKRKQLLLNLSL